MFNPRHIAVPMACGVLVFTGAALASSRNGADADGHYTALRPGLWEIRTATRMQGMPAELPPVPFTTTQCMTQEQLDNQQHLSTVSGARGTCDIHEADVTERRTSWTMTCHNNGMEIDAEGAITPISTEVYTGNVQFIMQGANMPALNGTVNVQGSWQGECADKQSGSGMHPSFRKPVYTPR